MEKSLNGAGYDLYEITPDMWMMHVKGTDVVYNGDFKTVVKHCVEKLGFDINEFSIGIEVLLEKQQSEGHNGMHFGMHKSFIFTFKKDFKNVQKVN